ncbi:NADH dehydrogenase [Heterostelium album PN500]|uniref:NADH dehydrogenase n=1 Tax=Heterostelium pallidum (strain ATCC 26659 / Pp 5 / PN500) TaxID=670386 RepID=D3BVI2_HETP5|nr:NADH dehydrogenase [Heterostelium album PN500]EFA74605.1 NADH dehydrogenase [Heterostelium album PN500]|eukprot:XP_020426739.1 NADH dehydrogenase [Heterostelium album PN500]
MFRQLFRQSNRSTVASFLKQRQYHTSRPLFSDALSRHIETEENNDHTPFDFNEENMVKVEKILSKYPPAYRQSAMIPLLDLAQRQNGGWISLRAMDKVAEIIGVPPMEAYEVASFYTMFNRTKIGKNFVQVCTTTPCMLRGSTAILDACKHHLKIGVGETTKDDVFTLAEVECLGACVNAPMICINDDFYEDLTPDSMKNLLNQIQNGKETKIGPQTHRKAAEGPQGKTTLLEQPSGPFCRDDLMSFNCPDCNTSVPGSNCAFSLSRSKGWKNKSGCESYCKCGYPIKAKQLRTNVFSSFLNNDRAANSDAYIYCETSGGQSHVYYGTFNSCSIGNGLPAVE